MFGIGDSKFAPGTVASFVTCLIFIIIFNYKINIIYLILIVSIIFIFSVYSIDAYRKSFDQVDSSKIVVDEFIGQSIPILTIYNYIPKNNIGTFILYIVISFILFRFFDIAKPYPANKIDKEMKNGFGVMLDDVVAGVYASIIILIIMETI